MFEKIFRAAKIANFTPREYDDYKVGLMKKWDYGASLKFEREEAMAIGKAEGIAIGEARLLQAARQMKAEGIGFDVISRVTGLSEDEIEKNIEGVF